MIELPVADPGRPDTRSPVRLLLWVGRHQRGTLAIAIVFGIAWMLSQALMPYAIGQAIQLGIVEGQNDELVRYCVLLGVLGLVQAFSGIMRHRYAVQNWLQAAFRLTQVVGHHVARTGDAVRGELSTGEVVATVSNDALRAGGAFDILARLAGGIVSYVVVAAILISTSPKLGLLVLLGVPVLTLSLSVVIRPLQERQREQREEVGRLTALGADTAAGLRVLRGVGGEQAFFDRYRRRSETVRIAGVRVATPQSTLDAAQVLLPGVFVVLVDVGRRPPRRLGGHHGRRARLVLRVRRIPRDPAADVGRGGGEVHARAHRLSQDAARARGRAHGRRPAAPAARAVAGGGPHRCGVRPDRGARQDDVPRLGLSRGDECHRRPARAHRRRAGGAARGHPARPAPARGGPQPHPRQ